MHIPFAQSRAAAWLARRDAAYRYTLPEILQQPDTWMETCERAIAYAAPLRECAAGIRSLVLTGSGSSAYAGECVRLCLQQDLQAVALTVSGGELLAGLPAIFPPGRPALMVSLARSGDSPESLGALREVRANAPDVRHLVLTCNPRGSLATSGAAVLALDERTNDRSLVMTSSFTNVALAARFLGLTGDPARYRAICTRLAETCRALFDSSFDAIVEASERPFHRAVFLGSGARHAAARESALKMLEMTAGRVPVLSETFLGFRHGPMSFADPSTLLVCYISSDPVRRGYESDLIAELHRKQLGMATILVGEHLPANLRRPADVCIEIPGLAAIPDAEPPLLYVVVGQLLAFGRCLAEGLHPDSPSEKGIISRVVESFPLYSAERA